MAVPVHALSVRKQVGINIRTLLVSEGLTAKNLAEHMGWTTSATSRRLIGQTALTVDEVASVAAFLGVDPGLLFRETVTVRFSPADHPRLPGFDIDDETDELALKLEWGLAS